MHGASFCSFFKLYFFLYFNTSPHILKLFRKSASTLFVVTLQMFYSPHHDCTWAVVPSALLNSAFFFTSCLPLTLPSCPLLSYDLVSSGFTSLFYSLSLHLP